MSNLNSRLFLCSTLCACSSCTRVHHQKVVGRGGVRGNIRRTKSTKLQQSRYEEIGNPFRKREWGRRRQKRQLAMFCRKLIFLTSRDPRQVKRFQDKQYAPLLQLTLVVICRRYNPNVFGISRVMGLPMTIDAVAWRGEGNPTTVQTYVNLDRSWRQSRSP